MSNIELQIGSITSYSEVDFPGHPSLVISLQGSIWDCFYSKKPLKQLFKKKSHYSWGDALIQIMKHRSSIDSIVFNGGEPTMQEDLPEAIKQVKEMGLLVCLYTSGLFPNKLSNCLNDIDLICFDFKAPFNRQYDFLKKADNNHIQPLISFKQIVASGKPYIIKTDFHCSQVKPLDSESLSLKLRSLNLHERTYSESSRSRKTSWRRYLRSQQVEDVCMIN
ncbi:MAG: hypothetical protein QNJ31_04905 [Candidatus Caenarcaniphilales bacterium]|nr:hypothetical protein [Candidatus Caenarcaniphilales bacterium]